MKFAFFGSSLVSAYWNGACTYYRGIVRNLAERGHAVTFYEPDAFDRQAHRDIPDPEWAQDVVYQAETEEQVRRTVALAANADVIVKTSGVGVFDDVLEDAVLQLKRPSNTVILWDVDAPATLGRMEADPDDSLRALVPGYDFVFTYGGGQPVVDRYAALGATACIPVYNALDQTTHHPVAPSESFASDLSFLGNRLPDREARVEDFFFTAVDAAPRRRFLLGGSGWDDRARAANLTYLGHVSPQDHNTMNCSARAVLNISRESMAANGYSPATRVFEAAGAGACLITDAWEGIDVFLEPEAEVLVAHDGNDVAAFVENLDPARARTIGDAARRRILRDHTYAHRAEQVEQILGAAMGDLTIVFLGLSVTSSWGNGHATNYRALMRCLDEAGHAVTFLERDVPWYAQQRDLPDPPWGRTFLYESVEQLRREHDALVRDADAVIVGSYVPDGVAVGEWVCDTARGVTAFYDIDTPVTLAKLEAGDTEYVDRDLVARYDLYLSFTGGPTLDRIQDVFGSPRARAFYCMVDPTSYYPQDAEVRWDLGYLGTYSDDRQPPLDELLVAPARVRPGDRFVVAGPQYPATISWPGNVERIEHLPPGQHRAFYTAQRFTLNVTRAHMIAAGHSPSVRLFEAAACGVPVISDRWAGIEDFFLPDTEILLADSRADVLAYLDEVSPAQRREIGERARARVLADHTAATRSRQLLGHLAAVEPALARDASLTLQSMGRQPAADEIGETINALAPWFHNLHLPSGHTTAPDHPLGDYPAYKWRAFSACLPDDLTGCSVLDVGCNAGAYSIGMAQRGARVLALDHDDHYLRQARWAAAQFGVADRIVFEQRGVYDLADVEGTFDVVLFMGVLYHLRYPLLALDLVAEKVRRTLVFQTLLLPGDEIVTPPQNLLFDDREQMLAAGWPVMAFIEHRLADDATNWWAPNAAAVEAMLRSAGMRVVQRPGQEVYVCEPETRAAQRHELDAALRRSRPAEEQGTR